MCWRWKNVWRKKKVRLHPEVQIVSNPIKPFEMPGKKAVLGVIAANKRVFTQEDTVLHDRRVLGNRTEHLMTSGKVKRGFLKAFFVFLASEMF